MVPYSTQFHECSRPCLRGLLIVYFWQKIEGFIVHLESMRVLDALDFAEKRVDLFDDEGC